MPPWLRQLLGLPAGSEDRSLADAIVAVLGRNHPALNEIHPQLRGGRKNPIPLEAISSLQAHETPFVRDTLQALVGGGVPVRAVEGGTIGELGGRRIGAEARLDSGIRYEPGEEVALPHEFGHIFDFRDRDPQLEAAVASRFDEIKPGTYEAQNPQEHFATAYSIAIGILRDWTSRPDSDPREFDRELRLMDQEVPGTMDVAMRLAQHPIYGGRFAPLMRSMQPERSLRDYLYGDIP